MTPTRDDDETTPVDRPSRRSTGTVTSQAILAGWLEADPGRMVSYWSKPGVGLVANVRGSDGKAHTEPVQPNEDHAAAAVRGIGALT